MIHMNNEGDVDQSGEELGLRINERFVYDYDFTDDWQHQIRVEAIITAVAGHVHFF